MAAEYDRVAFLWDRIFVPATNELRGRLAEAARFRPGERVLDMGTGTGAMAFLAARKIGRTGLVLGIDISSEMLAKARAKAARHGLRNVRFRRMDAASLRIPNASFDVIVSSFGTPEGVYDGLAVFRKWIRVLKPGGRVCFAESPGVTGFDKILARLAESYRVKEPSPRLAAKRRLREKIREERKHLSLITADDPEEVLRLMRTAGFRDVRVSTLRSRVTAPSARAVLDLFLSWDLADEYIDMPSKVRKQFRQEFLRALRPYGTPKGLRIPARTILFFGRKPRGSRLRQGT